jgi:hypothetical protein
MAIVYGGVATGGSTQRAGGAAAQGKSTVNDARRLDPASQPFLDFDKYGSSLVGNQTIHAYRKG